MEYRDSVIPNDDTVMIAVEQAARLGWERYVGRNGTVIAMETFGASAPLEKLQNKFGFTTKNLVETARERLLTKVGA